MSCPVVRGFGLTYALLCLIPPPRQFDDFININNPANNMRIGFAILLDDESHNFARKIELELCDKFGLGWGLKQSPHITIKSPFDTDKLEPFVKCLENLAKNTKSFDVELRGFNYFEPKVVFLDVIENPSLKRLHVRILEDLKKKFKIKPHELEGKNIKFHSTLALDDVTKTKFQKAKSYLKKYKPKFKFKAKTLGIFYYLGEDGGWIIVRRINLKS